MTTKGLEWLVSSNGRVWAPEKTTTYTRIRNGVEQRFKSTFKAHEISPTLDMKSGYLEVAIQHEDVRIRERVHRLVALAFVPGAQEDLTVNHVDGTKTNNVPTNLEWVSLARNTEHEWEIGLVDLNGERHPGAKLTSKRVVYIRRLLAAGISAHTLAIVAGVDNKVITKIRDGQAWKSITAAKPVVKRLQKR